MFGGGGRLAHAAALAVILAAVLAAVRRWGYLKEDGQRGFVRRTGMRGRRRASVCICSAWLSGGGGQRGVSCLTGWQTPARRRARAPPCPLAAVHVRRRARAHCFLGTAVDGAWLFEEGRWAHARRCVCVIFRGYRAASCVVGPAAAAAGQLLAVGGGVGQLSDVAAGSSFVFSESD